VLIGKVLSKPMSMQTLIKDWAKGGKEQMCASPPA
tara:strand:- start:573 stop:677 length:105 start_codon:yes stop_codon:yes gene_type:complete